MASIMIDPTEVSLEEIIKLSKKGRRKSQVKPEKLDKYSERRSVFRKEKVKEAFRNKKVGVGGVTKPNMKIFQKKNKWIVSRVLIVSNLTYRVSDSDMQEVFSEYGMLRSAKVNYDRSGRPLGTASVSFERKADAIRAMKGYDGVSLDDRAMKIKLTISHHKSDTPVQKKHSEVKGGKKRKDSGARRLKNGRNSTFYGDHRRRKQPKLTAEQLDSQLNEMMNFRRSAATSSF